MTLDSPCTHATLEFFWVTESVDEYGETHGGYWIADTVQTSIDFDLHRHQCIQCGLMMYYSDRARQFFEEGITFNIDGLRQEDLDAYIKSCMAYTYEK